MRSCLLVWALGGLICGPAMGGEPREFWPQWRGPNADGSSDSANPPVHWGPEENIQWKVEIPGEGSSTPVVWEDQVFILTAIPTERQKEPAAETGDEQDAAAGQDANGEQGAEEGASARRDFGRRRGRGRGRPRFGAGEAPKHYYQFTLISYDRNTGEKRWQTVATETVPHEGGHSTNTQASFSPVTDGEHLYVSFGSHGVFCFDMQGNPKWQRDLGQMETRNAFGEATSPALAGDTLVLTWDHEGPSRIIALDAATGETKWEVPRDERTTWATPLIVTAGGRTQVVTNGTIVRSYDLDSGELIWECGGQVSNPIPSPVRLDNTVYCMTGYRGNAVYGISLDSQGDVTDTDEVRWSRHDAAPYVSSPTLYKGQLYYTKSRSNILTSVDAETGEVIIDQQRINGIDSLYASPVAAADRVYFTSREGTTVVLRHGDELEVLATNQLGETIDASPALVGDQMFLRGEKHLFCIEEE